MSIRKNTKGVKQKNDEQTKKKKPLVQEYDKEGNLLGDDGYEMTSSRKRMHRILDGFFIAGILSALLCLFCIVFSYFQGQDYSYLELRASGGNLVNGWEFALLLRIESLYCLTLAVVLIASSITGFHWLYDSGSKRFLVLMGIEVFLSICTELFFSLVVGLIEPLSLIYIAAFCYALFSIGAVDQERQTLKKPKVAKRVVKK